VRANLEGTGGWIGAVRTVGIARGFLWGSAAVHTIQHYQGVYEGLALGMDRDNVKEKLSHETHASGSSSTSLTISLIPPNPTPSPAKVLCSLTEEQQFWLYQSKG